MITIEEDRMAKQMEQLELPGLINESLQCQCYLHGFEIDLDGNVIVPMLANNDEAVGCHHKLKASRRL